jgi:hypothetical protein
MATRYVEMLSYDPEQGARLPSTFTSIALGSLLAHTHRAGGDRARVVGHNDLCLDALLSGVLLVGGIMPFVSAFNARETGSLLLALGALWWRRLGL